MELQAEFFKKLIAPLLNETAGRDDENATGVSPHNQLTDIETGHDGLAGTGVIRQHKAQWLAREHGLIDSGNLVGERFHV